jgi:hypothetical protein
MLQAPGFVGSAVVAERGVQAKSFDINLPSTLEEKIAERIDAQLAAGTSHVCLLTLRCDATGLPDERALEAFARH